MRHVLILVSVLMASPVAFAGDQTGQPVQAQSSPSATAPQPVNIQKILQELRDMDTSTDRVGDHVVGEEMC